MNKTFLSGRLRHRKKEGCGGYTESLIMGQRPVTKGLTGVELNMSPEYVSLTH